MKKLTLIASLLMASGIWADEDVVAIKGLYKSWNEAVEASNIDGYINSLDDNITLIPPDGPIVSGTNNYRVFLGPVFDSATYKIKDKDYDIEIIGDIAIVRSRKTIYLTFPFSCLLLDHFKASHTTIAVKNVDIP